MRTVLSWIDAWKHHRSKQDRLPGIVQLSLGAVGEHILNHDRMWLVADLEDVLGLDEPESLVRRLEVIERCNREIDVQFCSRDCWSEELPCRMSPWAVKTTASSPSSLYSMLSRWQTSMILARTWASLSCIVKYLDHTKVLRQQKAFWLPSNNESSRISTEWARLSSPTSCMPTRTSWCPSKAPWFSSVPAARFPSWNQLRRGWLFCACLLVEWPKNLGWHRKPRIYCYCTLKNPLKKGDR